MRALAIGGVIVAVFAAAAVVSFFWTPYDVAAIDIAAKLQPSSAAHWLGTDHFGRDLLSMIMVGARTSIAVAFIATICPAVTTSPSSTSTSRIRPAYLAET